MESQTEIVLLGVQRQNTSKTCYRQEGSFTRCTGVKLEDASKGRKQSKIKERNRMQVILGTKIGMTQIIGEDGVVTPVTILQAGPCTVTQIKTVDTDGYNAVQVGYGQGKNLSKSVSGHVKKAGENINPKVLKEFRVEEIPEGMKLGDSLTVESFKLGDKVAVTGTSKGKGYAGTVKRHNFNESRNTHGFKGDIRKVGSIGSMYPQKVWKGKKMPGRMGHEQVTVKNLTVAYIDTANNLIGLKGAVPGPNKGIVSVEGEE